MPRNEIAAPHGVTTPPPARPRLARRLRVVGLYAGVRVLELVSRIVPGSAAPGLGAAIGRFALAVAPSLGRQPLRQLELCYGDTLPHPARKALVRGLFDHLGRSVFEVLRLRRLTPERVDKMVDVEGIEHLQAVQRAGRGFIIVTGHLGNWELMAAWVAQRVPLSVLARFLPNWKLNEWLVETRRRQGVRTVYRGSFEAAREALRALRRGEALGILIDQDTAVDGDFVPFFGRPAFTPTGAAALALRTGAPLLPTFIHRDRGRHRIVFEPPVHVENRGTKHETQRAYTALLTERIEHRIRQHPEQWVWMHRRFRTKPPAGALS